MVEPGSRWTLLGPWSTLVSRLPSRAGRVGFRRVRLQPQTLLLRRGARNALLAAHHIQRALHPASL